jgi:alkylation response protein AidB-like acyl-CoA dehydrogenase
MVETGRTESPLPAKMGLVYARICTYQTPEAAAEEAEEAMAAAAAEKAAPSVAMEAVRVVGGAQTVREAPEQPSLAAAAEWAAAKTGAAMAEEVEKAVAARDTIS